MAINRVLLTIILVFVLVVDGQAKTTEQIAADVAALQPGEWYEVIHDSYSTLDSVKHSWATVPTMNGVGFPGIITAWNGGVMDTAQNRFIIWGGGHKAYGGNEMYGFSFDTFQWSKITEPTAYEDITLGTPYYADGMPSSRHTYSRIAYSPTLNALVSVGVAAPYNGDGTIFRNVDYYNFNLSAWNFNIGQIATGYDYHGEVACESDGTLWYISAGTDRTLYSSSDNGATWSARTSSGTAIANYQIIEVDPDNDRLLLVGNTQYIVFDISGVGIVTKTATSSTGAQNVVASGNPTLAYDSVANKFVSWIGGTTVYSVDTTNNQWEEITAADGSPNPGSPTCPTYGRWRYVPSLNVFVTVLSTTGHTWLYKFGPDALDETDPVVTAFTLPETSDTQTVTISTFTATDNVSVYKYCVSESALEPALSDSCWASSPQTTYQVSGNGSHTLYGWARDIQGNVSAGVSDTTTVTADSTPPTVTAFDLPETATSLTFAVSSFTASDNVGVTGYLINEVSDTPDVDDSGWAETAQATYTATGCNEADPITVYAWAKDAEGNISSAGSDTIVINLSHTEGALLVGPYHTYQTIAAAVAAASNDDVIEIDAGTYPDEIVNVTKSGLTIRGMGGGYAHIDYTSAATVEHGLIKINTSGATTLEYLELSGAHNGDNGAGVRNQTTAPGDLTLNNCYVHGNEMGVSYGYMLNRLEGVDVVINQCEFDSNGLGDGQSHNMYIARVDSLTVQYSHIHRASVGHNIKSRAEYDYILYNRITDETGPNGQASYAIDLGQGGYAYVIGNLIHKGSSANQNGFISFGVDIADYGWCTGKSLWVVNNTFYNQYAGGYIIKANSGADVIQCTNNVFYSPSATLYQYLVGGFVPTFTNCLQTGSDPGFTDIANFDASLLITATTVIDQGSDPGSGGEYSLTPTKEYVSPLSSQNRPSSGVLDLGAFEYEAPAVEIKSIGGSAVAAGVYK